MKIFEKPCEARFSTISKISMPDEGGPCRISLLKLASSQPKPDKVPASGYVWFRSQPMWFVRTDHRRGLGQDWMITWRVGSPQEDPDDSPPRSSVLVGKVNCSGRWFKGKWVFLDIHLKAAHLENIALAAGNPTILERFMPCRRPAVFRVRDHLMEPWVLL
jgi:hypothetical protein